MQRVGGNDEVIAPRAQLFGQTFGKIALIQSGAGIFACESAIMRPEKSCPDMRQPFSYSLAVSVPVPKPMSSTSRPPLPIMMLKMCPSTALQPAKGMYSLRLRGQRLCHNRRPKDQSPLYQAFLSLLLPI